MSVEDEVMAVLDAWMVGFNDMDAEAWGATFQFPSYRLASASLKSGQITVIEGLDTEKTKASLQAGGWHHSKWSRRNIIHSSDTKVHVDTNFTRYREDGSVIGSYDSLYILTKENGKWGVKMRSSYAG